MDWQGPQKHIILESPAVALIPLFGSDPVFDHVHTPRTHTPTNQVILQHFYLRKDSVLSQYEAWKAELEEALKKARQGDSSVHVLRNHLLSLNKSMDTLKAELDKIKVQDFQPPAPVEGSDGH